MKAWFMSLFCPPPASEVPACQEQEAWVGSYRPPAEARGEFALDHARRVYDEFLPRSDVLDGKAADLLRAAGLLATLLIGFARYAEISVWSMVWSLVCFLLTMIVATIARTPMRRPAQASIRVVLESAHLTDNPTAWLAASLHRTVQQHRVVLDWKARRIYIASWLFCLGVLLLAVIPC